MIETRRLKNVVIFVQAILSFLLSRIIEFFNTKQCSAGLSLRVIPSPSVFPLLPKYSKIKQFNSSQLTLPHFTKRMGVEVLVFKKMGVNFSPKQRQDITKEQFMIVFYLFGFQLYKFYKYQCSSQGIASLSQEQKRASI